MKMGAMSRVIAFAKANNWPVPLALEASTAYDIESLTEAQLLAMLDEVNNVIDACGWAGKPELIRQFVMTKTPLADARRALQIMLAEADEATVIDTARRLPSSETAADIWTLRREQSKAGAELQGVWKARAEGTST